MKYGIERYLNVRSAYGASFSPDGSTVAFLTNITGVPQVWSVSARGGWPHQLTFFGERVSFARYSPTADELVFGMDAGGNERQQLYLVSRDGADVRELTHSPDAIHTFGCWSQDGRQICYCSNSREPSVFDIYLLDLKAPPGEGPRLVYEGSGGVQPISWSPDGGRIIFALARSSGDNELYVLDVASGQAEVLTTGGIDSSFRFAAWDAAGKGIFTLSNQGRDFRGLVRIDVDSGQTQNLVSEDWDLELLSLSPDGGRLAYTVNVDGYSDLRVRDLSVVGSSVLRSAEGDLLVGGLPRGTITSVSWAPDNRSLAVDLMAPTYNHDVWIADTTAGSARRLTRSSLAGIPREGLVEPELVRFESFDSLEIPAFFYQPPGSRKDGSLPVVVDVHGGPESQERPDFNPVIQYLVSCGYGVLAPNVRGSTGYGKQYTHLDDVEKRMDAVRDLKYAVKWLTETGSADPQRIAVMGGSYGGFMVLAAMTTHPHLWAAGVDIVGIANFKTFLENTGPWRRKLRAVEYGSLERDADLLRDISPIHRVDQVAAPLLVIHGSNDPRVPVGEAEQIVAELRERGMPVQYLRFEDEGHGIVKLANRITAYSGIVNFLERHLKGVDLT